jgi:hypothetical protein
MNVMMNSNNFLVFSQRKVARNLSCLSRLSVCPQLDNEWVTNQRILMKFGIRELLFGLSVCSNFD